MEMEDQSHDPVIYLKINLRCCEECPKKLKKAMLKMNGVYSVAVDEKKGLVTVTGDVDPLYLVKTIAKWGKTAELLPYGKYPKKHYNSGLESTETSDNHSHGSSGHHTVKPRGKKPQKHYDCGHGTTESSNASDYNSHGSNEYSTGRCRRHSAEDQGEKEEEHECESYEKPKIDERICRDMYCKLHARKSTINSKVPSKDNEDHPRHTDGIFDEEEMGGYPMFDQTMPRGYYPPRRMPFPAYGPSSRRFMPGNREQTYSGRAMPLPGYNDYLGRARPLTGYGARPLPGYGGYNYR